MKKVLFLFAIVSSISLAISNASFAMTQNTQEKGYITVNSSESLELEPDVAELSFAIQTTDTKSMQKATIENKEISDKMYSVLSELLNPANGDFIKTSDFQATPRYTYNSNKKNFDRYEVSNRVTIHTKSLDKLGQMIDKAIEAGATNVDSLTFSKSDYEAQCNDLLTKATLKAKNRANIIAKTLSTTVEGIKSISVNCNANEYRYPRLYMAKNMMFDSANGSENEVKHTYTNINSGNIKINASVNTNFFVK